MKLLNKTFVITAITLATMTGFTACEDDLNTVPEGSTVTETQKTEAVESNPELLAADVSAMSANMVELFGILGEGIHSDFGYASACLFMESNGADMTSANIGYNWFRNGGSYEDRNYVSDETTFMWNFFYKQIASANLVIKPIDPATTNKTLKAYLGQALAVRAFDYFSLAQLHQFTYVGNEDKLCVPIVTEKTTDAEGINNPRATVKKVYELIISDLNRAIRLLEGYKRPDKGFIDEAIAYGLRARVNLVMNKWADAASDAKKALELSGATPYSKAEVSKPAFWSANDNTVMWANIITENNNIVKSAIVNAPSHLCSFALSTYVGVGCWKKINQPLYDMIPASDVRKGWWLDAQKSSPLVADAIYSKWREKAEKQEDFGAYTNVKFGAYKEEYDYKKMIPAQDWFLMRAEEMILIQAEGLAMSGKEGEGKALLEGFIKTNRDEEYVLPAGNFQDEVWKQRRIELWGEGFSFYDVMRLKKPIQRIENGVSTFADAFKFNIEAESAILLWLVPKAEIEANAGISEADNNEKVIPPKP